MDAAGADKGVAASAAEGMSGAEQTFHERLQRLRKKALLGVEIRPTAFPQGLKSIKCLAFTAWLKPHPFKAKGPLVEILNRL